MYIYVNTLVCIVLQYPGKLGLYMDLLHSFQHVPGNIELLENKVNKTQLHTQGNSRKIKINHSRFYSNCPKFIVNMSIVSKNVCHPLYIMVTVSFLDSFFFSSSFLYNSLIEARILGCPVGSLWSTVLIKFLFDIHGQHLASKRKTFSLFNHLLIGWDCIVTHYHVT